jgi:Co/Zn/Cd efflux system component
VGTESLPINSNLLAHFFVSWAIKAKPKRWIFGYTKFGLFSFFSIALFVLVSFQRYNANAGKILSSSSLISNVFSFYFYRRQL